MSIPKENLSSFPNTSLEPLPPSSLYHSAANSSFPSESACRISAKISDQKLKHVLPETGPFSEVENLPDQHAKEEQVLKVSQPSTIAEGTEEIQGRRLSTKDLSIQDSEKTGVEEANKKGSPTWLGCILAPVVTPLVSVPFVSNRPAKKQLLKLWRSKLEKEDEIKNGEAETQRKIIDDLEHENADKNNNIQRTRSINCIINDQSDVPIAITDGVNEKKDVLMGATVEHNGKLKTGRKPKDDNQSANFKLTIEYEAKETRGRGRPKKIKCLSYDRNSRNLGEQKAERGRPNNVKDQSVTATEGSEGQGRKRGRPKKVKAQLVDENGNHKEQEQQKGKSKAALQPLNQNEHGGEQKRKRGRPKKVKDHLVDANKCEGEPKPKRGRPKKVKDQSTNDKSEEEQKLERGRPIEIKDQLDNDECVEKPKKRKKKRIKLCSRFILS